MRRSLWSRRTTRASSMSLAARSTKVSSSSAPRMARSSASQDLAWESWSTSCFWTRCTKRVWSATKRQSRASASRMRERASRCGASRCRRSASSSSRATTAAATAGARRVAQASTCGSGPSMSTSLRVMGENDDPLRLRRFRAWDAPRLSRPRGWCSSAAARSLWNSSSPGPGVGTTVRGSSRSRRAAKGSSASAGSGSRRVRSGANHWMILLSTLRRADRTRSGTGATR